MKKYVCEKCNENFKSKQGLIRHESRKIPCNEQVILNCERCKKTFKTNQGLARHQNRKKLCDVIKVSENNLQIELDIEKEKTRQVIIKSKNNLEKIAAQKNKEIEIEMLKLQRKEITTSIAIYVISNEEHITHSKYKIGRTSSTRKKLETTYQRYLNNAKVLLYHETNTAEIDETNILTYFKDKRQLTSTGRLNEWIYEDFNIIKKYIDEEIIKIL
jgi:hypothetical protein